ncbi:MAG: hypothetical protein M5T61_09665 [Acidimicrobiia bacterium]|nr:hypothetical protein [Acidimicrobiia bacterium]
MSVRVDQRVSRVVGSWPGDPVSLDEAGAKVLGQGRIQAVVVDALELALELLPAEQAVQRAR